MYFVVVCLLCYIVCLMHSTHALSAEAWSPRLPISRSLQQVSCTMLCIYIQLQINYVYIYIYTHILHTYRSLSLSLYTYIYIYMLFLSFSLTLSLQDERIILPKRKPLAVFTAFEASNNISQ